MTALARMDFATIIVWLLGLGAFISVAVFAFSFAIKGKRSKRIKAVVNQHRGDLSRGQAEGLARPSVVRQKKVKAHEELAQKLLAALKLQNVMFSDNIRNNLAQAGIRGRAAVTVYVASRIVGIVVGFFLTLTLVGLMKNFNYPDIMKFVFAAIGGGVGFYMPKILLSNTIQKRQTEMTSGFPDTLDLLQICVESGLSVELAFSRVTEEIMENSPILAQELGLTSAELAYLGDRRIAYENFSKRVGLPTAKSLATTLIQSEQYGTPVGAALNVLAQEKRDERMSAAEKKAAALPAKLTVPMIIFFLPVLFVVVISPAILKNMGD